MCPHLPLYRPRQSDADAKSFEVVLHFRLERLNQFQLNGVLLALRNADTAANAIVVRAGLAVVDGDGVMRTGGYARSATGTVFIDLGLPANGLEAAAHVLSRVLGNV